VSSSKGNLYVGEDFDGRRFQRFVYKGMGAPTGSTLPPPMPRVASRSGGSAQQEGGQQGFGDRPAAVRRQLDGAAARAQSVACAAFRRFWRTNSDWP
jgi:hypothetical protein